MYFNPGPAIPLIVAFFFLLFVHIIWIIQILRKSILGGNSGRGLVIVLLAAVVPLVSFYIALIIDRSYKRQSIRVEDARWRWAMSVLGVGAVAAAAVRTNLRYAPAYRSLSGTIEGLGPWALVYILIASIAYMAVYVFGKTRRNPFFSRSQLLASVFVLWLAFA